MAMNSKNSADLIRIYAAQGKEDQAMRIYVENRVSMQVYMKALREGRRIKEKTGRAVTTPVNSSQSSEQAKVL